MVESTKNEKERSRVEREGGKKGILNMIINAFVSHPKRNKNLLKKSGLPNNQPK